MKECPQCKKEIADEAVICTGCGCKQNNSAVNAKGGIGWWLLGFFVPVAGLILFGIWREQYPKKAKSCGWGALISLILMILLFILYFVILVTAVILSVRYI